jgi:ribosomal protein S18 acetylase RimI-like enzyme
MSCDVMLRPATAEDAEECKEIGVRGWETTYSDFVRPENRRRYLDGAFWSLDRLREVLSDRCAINIVAEQHGMMIGFITTEPLENGRYEVTRLYVDPDSRSRGVGARLLTTVFDELRARRASEVVVNVFGDNHDGRRFYKRHGFELTDDVWCMVGDQRLSDVWYKKPLTNSNM